MPRFFGNFPILWIAMNLSACAYLHKVQLSDVDGAANGKPISVKVSETTIDFREAGQIAKAFGSRAGKQAANDAGKVLDYYRILFQFGPSTGAPVFNELYARNIPEMLEKSCKGGRLSNVISVREQRAYPIVKGEIVRVDATCIKGKGGDK